MSEVLKTAEQLSEELAEARRLIAELTRPPSDYRRIGDAIMGGEGPYRSLVENAHDVIWVFDLNLGYTYVSPSVKNLRGYTVEEALKLKIDQVLTPESAKKARELFARERDLEMSGHHHGRGWSFTADFEMYRKDGSTFWAEITMNPLYDERGRIRGIMGITRDISERKGAEEVLREHHARLEEVVAERTTELKKANELLRKEITERIEAEEKLRRNEERYRIYFSHSNDVMFSYDNQFRVQGVTPNVERILGYRPDELVGKTFFEVDVLHPDYMEKAVTNALKVLSGEVITSSVFEFITKDGVRKVGELSGVPVMHSGRVEGEISIARDITERVAMQRSLEESEERYRITLQTMPDAVSILTARDLRYIYVNEAFSRITGHEPEEVMGKTPFDLDLPASPEDISHCGEILKNVQPVDNMGHKCRRKDGAVIDTIISTRPVLYGGQDCIVMVMTDITALKQIEEEKKRLDIRSQKIEAIGILANGIAHDFNNILTSILGYTKMSMKDFMALKKDDKDLSAVQNDLTEVRNAAYRARDLVNHILAFSRHAEKDYSPVALGSTIKKSLAMLRQSLPSNIAIREDIRDEQYILGDSAQIHLIVANLCTNAAYAMNKSGGIVEVGLLPVVLDGTAPDLDAHAGPYVKLSVKDSGHGMSPQVMARIFDPYFTTKAKGQATGLGLSVVHGIVKSHGGTILCTSLQGKGTTFDIYFPRYELSDEPDTVHRDGDKRILNLDEAPAQGVTEKRKENGRPGEGRHAERTPPRFERGG